MKYFLTYGDKNFLKSRERIINEAKQLNIFDEFILKTEDIRNEIEIKQLIDSNEDFKFVFNSRRGGGYYIWKPYVICKTLQKLDHGDILVYLDSGSQIKSSRQSHYDRVQTLFETLENDHKGVMSFPMWDYPRNSFKEEYWTTGDIFDHFDCRD